MADYGTSVVNIRSLNLFLLKEHGSLIIFLVMFMSRDVCSFFVRFVKGALYPTDILKLQTSFPREHRLYR